uniref:Kallikrein related peptidase 11 n=1 Tax=Moschus moschiferus TaxID=68415 RepID=A0A8C6DE97_MOSMO
MMTLQLIMFALVTGHVRGETRIIKGYECAPHSQPWQAALFQKTRLLCGATLIAPRWLLTAAHCRKPRYVVHLGAHSLRWQDGCEQTRTATESFPHPDFNNSLPNKDHRNDIMLVKMMTPAHLNWAVRPLTVSPQCVPAGANCLISGWGTVSSPQLHLPRTLRCANITIIKHGECEDAYPGNITDTMVCASVRKEGKDSCQVRGQGLGLRPHFHSQLPPQLHLHQQPESHSPTFPSNPPNPAPLLVPLSNLNTIPSSNLIPTPISSPSQPQIMLSLVVDCRFNCAWDFSFPTKD